MAYCLIIENPDDGITPHVSAGAQAMSGSPEHQLYYEERGDGIPILMIHPSGATASTWDGVLDELARFGRVISYDRRGYIRSGGEPPSSIATHTADAAALLDALQAQPVVAVGTSVGATIAIDLALRRPDLVRAVVAHESPWRVTRQPPTRPQIAALASMTWLAARGRHPAAAARFLRFAYTYRDGDSAWDAFPEAWRQTVSENARAALTDIRIAISGYPAAKELAAMRPPVFCTHGARSTKTMARVTRSLARAIPTARLTEIPEAGHAAAFDAPANFVEVIVEAVRMTSEARRFAPRVR
jgi:pimeloyl-ACP methyl ester carboxylesterase